MFALRVWVAVDFFISANGGIVALLCKVECEMNEVQP